MPLLTYQRQQELTIIEDIIFEVYNAEDDTFHLDTHLIKISRNQFTSNSVVILIFCVIDKTEISTLKTFWRRELHKVPKNQSNSHTYT